MFTAIYFSIAVILWVFFYVTIATSDEPQYCTFKEEQILILGLSGIMAVGWPVTITGMFVMNIGNKLSKRTNKKED